MNKKLFETIETFQNLLIDVATGASRVENEDDYKELKRKMLETEDIRDMVPSFIVTNRTVSQFWQFIKGKFPTYAERRKFIWEEFSKLLNYAEQFGSDNQKMEENIGETELEHPIVFISYSWDDDEHKDWVLKIANRLRSDGVDVILDRYHLRPGVNLSLFVENSLRTSNRIITILTPQYKEKADKRKGGVGQEFTIINNELIKNIANNDRIIPVLRKGNSESSIPDFLKTYIYVNFLNDDEFNHSYEELLREIFKSPKIALPKLGTKPSFLNNEENKEIEHVLPPIISQEANNKVDEIKKITHSFSKGNYEERKKKAIDVYEIALNIPLGEILNLVDDKDLDVNIATAISLKSITENHNIDLGTNPNIRQFVVSNLNSKSSFLRYRIFDYISVSEILQKDFKGEIERQLSNEKNEEVASKINSILGIKPAKTETNKQRIKTKLQSLLMNNKINEVLKELTGYTQNGDSDIRNSIIMLSAQFAQLEGETRKGTISYSDVNIQRNRLMNSLISLVNEI